jgi:hypothetical protein
LALEFFLPVPSARAAPETMAVQMEKRVARQQLVLMSEELDPHCEGLTR